MLLHRRQFLRMLGVATVAAATNPFAASANGPKRYLITDSPNAVCSIDISSMEATFTPLDFTPHSYIHNSADPTRVWAIEKWAAHAVEIDIREAKITRQLQNPKGAVFYGHGLFWKEKNLLLVTCVDLKTGQGHLAGYDYTTLQQVAEFSATPGGLHDCHFISDDTILIASSGIKSTSEYPSQTGPRLEPSALVELNLSTGKALSKKTITDDDQLIAHFNRLTDGTIIALSTPYPSSRVRAEHGNVYFARSNSELQNMPLDLLNLPRTPFKGEMLSITTDEKHNIAAVTNPGSSTVLFLDTKQAKIVHRFPLDGNGMALDHELGFLSSGTTLTQIDLDAQTTRTLTLKNKSNSSGIFRASAHSLII